MADKIYTKGIYFKVIPTKNGEIKKLSFHREKFINWLEEQEVTEKGYLSIEIKSLDKPDQYGNLYSLLLDTWKPDPNYKKPEPGQQVRQGSFEPQPQTGTDEDLPFN